jgi:hypothetical protein
LADLAEPAVIIGLSFGAGQATDHERRPLRGREAVGADSRVQSVSAARQHRDKLLYTKIVAVVLTIESDSECPAASIACNTATDLRTHSLFLVTRDLPSKAAVVFGILKAPVQDWVLVVRIDPKLRTPSSAN